MIQGTLTSPDLLNLSLGLELPRAPPMRRRWLACAALAAARSPWEASQDAAQCARLGDAAGACAAAQVGLHGARVARGGAPVFVVGAEHAGTRYVAVAAGGWHTVRAEHGFVTH